jgi:hypothetical protein
LKLNFPEKSSPKNVTPNPNKPLLFFSIFYIFISFFVTGEIFLPQVFNRMEKKRQDFCNILVSNTCAFQNIVALLIFEFSQKIKKEIGEISMTTEEFPN